MPRAGAHDHGEEPKKGARESNFGLGSKQSLMKSEREYIRCLKYLAEVRTGRSPIGSPSITLCLACSALLSTSSTQRAQQDP